MKRNVAMLLTVLLIFMLSACTGQTSGVSSMPQGADSSDIVKEDTAPASGESLNGFSLSDMVVKVTCGERTATFRLYDTNAAKELYAQLPLSLELEDTIEIRTPKGWTQWCFCYKVQYLCGFSRSHFVFIIWTENRKSANLKLKNLKTNNYEPVSLFALAHKSASFKAYSSSFCSGDQIYTAN